jgi:hypothetical protein
MGVIICVAFGGVWAAVGATGLSHPWRWQTAVLAVLISVAIIVWRLMTHVASGPGTFRGDVYAEAVASEAVGIVAAVWLLRRFGRPRYILPVIGLVVGLHFIGLWKATDLLAFVWTAIGMAGVSLISLGLPSEPAGRVIDVRRVVSCFGCALVLWATGISGLR